MSHPFKRPVIIFWCFFGWKHRKNWTLSLKDSQMWQKNLNNIFFKNLKFVWSLTFFKTCDDFLGGFWGEKIVKSIQNLKNIPKRGTLCFLTNSFVKNIILYFKQPKKKKKKIIWCNTFFREVWWCFNGCLDAKVEKG